jgi:hypothetical protein
LLSFRQICPTFEFAADTLVFECFRLVPRLQFECEPDSVKAVRALARTVTEKDELNGLLIPQRILDAVHGCAGILQSGLPFSESRDDCSMRCNKDGISKSMIFTSIDIVEFGHRGYQV